MKRASRLPTTVNAVPKGLAIKAESRSPRPPLRRPSRIKVSTNVTSVNRPYSCSAHTPSDMGDQYLKLSPPAGPVSISMCQKRSGRPRSAVSRIGQTTSVGKAM